MGKNEKALENNDKKGEMYMWLNRKIQCSPHLYELRDDFLLPRPYDFKEKRQVFVEVDHLSANSYTKKILVEEEFYKEPQEILNQIANSNLSIAKAEICSGKMISESIIKSSQILSNSLENLTNELERKHKLDEYYMLGREIEQYEDKLLELGCFDEAYEELNLFSIPMIYLNYDEARVLLSTLRKHVIEPNVIKRTMELVKQHFEHPLVFLPRALYERELFYRRARFDSAYRVRCDLYDTTSILLDSPKLDSPRLDDMPPLSTYEEKVKELYREFAKYPDNSGVKYTAEYVEIMDIINTVNREIALCNLRNLHSELRRIVRKYKIKSYSQQ